MIDKIYIPIPKNEIHKYMDDLNKCPLKDLPNEETKLMLTNHNYLNSFLDDKEFTESKRFSRYIEKSKTYILENILKQLYPAMFIYSKEDEIDGIRLVKTVDDFIINTIYCHYFAPQYKDRTDIRIIVDQMFGHCVKAMPIEQMDGELLHDYFKGVNNPKLKEDFTSIDECVADEYETAIVQFMREKSLRMGNIDSSNYFLTMPDCYADAMRIIELTMNLVRSDIEIMYDYYVVREEFENTYKEELTELEKLKIELENQKKENEKELQKARVEISKLNEKLSKKITSETDNIERLKDENNTLLQQNSKLTKRYEGLMNKYSRLKESATTEELEDEKINEKEQMQELDMNGKYAFVLYEDSKFIDNIKREFPNAILIHTNTNIKSMNIDLVVFVSTQVHHSTYFGIKNQCRDNNIPFISCGNSNINIIKEIMRNELYL